MVPEWWEDVVARAEHHRRAVGGQRVQDGGGTFGVSATLVMDEIADRPRHAALASDVDWALACAKACIPSTTPAAWGRRAR